MKNTKFSKTRTVVILGTMLHMVGFAHAKGQYEVYEGSQATMYSVAPNEFYQIPKNGGKAKTVKVSGAKEAKSITSDAKSDYKVVLYKNGNVGKASDLRVVTDKVLVRIDDESLVEAIFTSSEATSYTKPDYAEDLYIFEYDETGESLEKIDALKALDGVESAELLLSKMRSKRQATPDPLYAYNPDNDSYQWHLNNIGVNGGVEKVDVNIAPLWQTYKGAGVVVGVVDDGVNLTHPDLEENINTVLDHNWNDGDARSSNAGAADTHGTPVAGVIAAVDNNGLGGTGAAPDAQIVGLRLIAGVVSDSDEAEAMGWRSDAIDIKNHSWGPTDGTGSLADAGDLVKAMFKNTVEVGRSGNGTIHVWAAGNGSEDDNVNYDGYANSIYTIAIGSVNDKGERSSYSEPGAAKVVSATSDGGNRDQGVTTSAADGGFTSNFGGTSSATPLASGVIALMLEANENLGWRDVQEILIRSARKINPTHESWAVNGAGIPFSHDYGAGLIDAVLAVGLAKNWTNLDTQNSTIIESGDLSLSIPDNSNIGAEYKFNITDDFRLEHVTLTASITHIDRSELDILLISPSGTTSVLAKQTEVPTGESDINNWKFMTVHNWGEMSQGEWTLRVIDKSLTNVGVLTSAAIEVFGTNSVPSLTPPAFINLVTGNGQVNVPFGFKVFTADQASYSATSLPAGLSIDSVSGLISGVPTESGSISSVITATNSNGVGEVTVVFEILPADLPIITSELSVVADIVNPFNYRLSAVNLPTEYSATSLPEGLSLDTATGVISGTPIAFGEYEVPITLTNVAGVTSDTLTINVNDVNFSYALALESSSDINYTTEEGSIWRYQTTIFTNDNDALASPELGDREYASFSIPIVGPSTLTFSSKISSEENADYFRVTTESGELLLEQSGEIDWINHELPLVGNEGKVIFTYEKDFSAIGGDDTVYLDNLKISPSVLTISSELTDFTDLVQPYSYQVGTSLPVSNYSASGLPIGLAINSVTGEITGVANQIGLFNVVLTASDALSSASANLSLEVVADLSKSYSEALDNDALSVAVSGNQLWLRQSVVTRVGGDALQSPALEDNEQSRFSINVDGPSTLQFWVKASTEEMNDTFTIINARGNILYELSGEQDWSFINIELSGDEGMLTFTYSKNGSLATGDDAIYLDELSLVVNPSYFATALTNSNFNFQIPVGSQGDTYTATSLPSGLTLNSSTGLIIGSISESGIYSIPISVANESTTRNVVLTLYALESYSDLYPIATEIDDLTFNVEANDIWQIQQDDSANDNDALVSSPVGHDGISKMSFNVPGPGIVYFRVKTSTEPENDLFTVSTASGLILETLSGERDWAYYYYALTGLESKIFLTYQKNGSVVAGLDRVWIDDFTWVPDTVNTISAWKTEFFTAEQLVDDAFSANLADPDGDGLTNLEEYAFGSNPMAEDQTTTPMVQISDDSIQYIYDVVRTRSDITVTAQTSDDLSVSSVWTVVNPVASETTTSVERRVATMPKVSGQKGFLRLCVE